MNGPTSRLGGLLDVVATRSDLPPPTIEIMDVELSDHHLLQWTVPTARLLLSSTSIIERRLWKSLDIGKFRSELSLSALCQPDVWQGSNVDDLAELYNNEVTIILNRQLPTRTIKRQPRPSVPWFDAGCRAAKRSTRRLERAAAAAAKSQDTKASVAATEAWRTQRRLYRNLRDQKREEFLTRTVVDNRSSPRELWRSVNTLLGRSRVNADDDISSDQFHHFFVDKVAAVCTATADGTSPTYSSAPIGAAICDFKHVTIDEVVTLICRLPDESCALDVLPTSQLKSVADLVAPFMCELYNRSLSTATVPAAFKSAYITLLLKKADLNTADVRSY